MDQGTRFAGYPSAVIYAKPRTTAAKHAKQHLLWGDWMSLMGPTDGPWRKVRARRVTGWVHERELIEDRLLEVNFVDIGQGDGCLVVTPQDKRIVIDAGERDNMYRFLRWRFGYFRKPVRFESFIVSHPDKDHYYGFRKLLDNKNVLVDNLYHNGIVDRKGDDNLGPVKKFGGVTYLDDVISTPRKLKTLLAGEKRKRSRKLYPSMLRRAVEGGRVERLQMLTARDEYLPGYGTGENLHIKVLAPVMEKCRDRRWRLRRFGNDGLTKNGHSIVLKLHYGDVSLLLGGDLNTPAENHLLKHYTRIDPEKARGRLQGRLVSRARKVLQVDVAKACHHGSPDFTELFLRAVNPIATVVSSGDGNSYAHPRPDALGAFGRYARGVRPLIFSTELARASRETIEHPYLLKREMKELREEARSGATKAIRERADAKLAELVGSTIERSVAVYGMITLRTDGKRVLVAQKLESPANNKRKWDIHRIEPGAGGKLAYVSPHAAH